MKQFVLLLTLILLSTLLFAQRVYRIQSDSVHLNNDSNPTELILENSTKDTSGFLFNRGGGRTEFRRVMQKLSDSVYVFGRDTLKIANRSGSYIQNQYGAKQTASAWLDSVKMVSAVVSGRTMLGGATDDGATTLQVKGVAKLDTLQSTLLKGQPSLMYTDSLGMVKKVKGNSLITVPEIVMYKAHSNFLSLGFEPVTKSGALASATITSSGMYDKIKVGSGTQTSYLTLNKVISSDANRITRLTIRVDSMGAAPYVGIAEMNSSFNPVSRWKRFYFNLKNIGTNWDGVNWSRFDNYTSLVPIDTPFCKVGDILEIGIERSGISFTGWVKNARTGNVHVNYFAAPRKNWDLGFQNMGFILSDGIFLVMDYTISTKTGIAPKIMLLGDDLYEGWNEFTSYQLSDMLIKSIPFRIADYWNSGNGGLNSVANVNVKDIITLKPELILLSNWTDLYYSRTDTNTAAGKQWVKDFKKIIGAANSYGGKVAVLESRYINAGGMDQLKTASFNTVLESLAPQLGFDLIDLGVNAPYTPFLTWGFYNVATCRWTRDKVLIYMKEKGFL